MHIHFISPARAIYLLFSPTPFSFYASAGLPQKINTRLANFHERVPTGPASSSGAFFYAWKDSFLSVSRYVLFARSAVMQPLYPFFRFVIFCFSGGFLLSYLEFLDVLRFG